ncbi:TetR/AcrR family transcriptional regulator [Bacillus sp. BRMEA1]|uniref:TetR/AcrR family transcriptional regulator n=1 Tax=Neobacillus endophyticus TaxID=2738405 RepID=UPI001567A3B7|nr:TetR/AcrR family transcriptional regulator [Neobacillus endophyticus]NRD79079.1 TetR/AcrR family transcriptional regulator [Neobacillus endophyticus]
MSRPREFDINHALYKSMEVFWTKGFKSTSLEDLTSATQVKKQSLYCVFENKRSLFLKALALYREQAVAVLEELVSQETSPLEKLKSIRDFMLCKDKETIHRGCFIVNSSLEFGTDDEEVTRVVESMFADIEQILEKVIRSGQEQQLITKRHTSKELAAYLNNAIVGARIMEKSGASLERIEAVLRTSFALIAT